MLQRIAALEEGNQEAHKKIQVMETLISKSKELRRTAMTNRKGFSIVPHYSGRIDEYEMWNFKMVTFLSEEEGFREFIDWIEGSENLPMEPDLMEFQGDNPMVDVEWLNAQLHLVLSMNVVHNALALIKNLKNKDVNGVQGWWKLKNEASGRTAQRTQGLAEMIFNPKKIKNFADLMVGIEEWEGKILEYEQASRTVFPEGLEIFSLKNLVPDELTMDIQRQSNNLKNYSEIRDYVLQQINLRRLPNLDLNVNKKTSGYNKLQQDLAEVAQGLNEMLRKVGGDAGSDPQRTSCEGGEGGVQEAKHLEQLSPLLDNLHEVYSMVKGLSGKGKGKSWSKSGTQFNGYCNCCGKWGHRLAHCWVKDEEMKKGKGGWQQKGNDYKGEGKSKGGKGAGGKGKGLYWFDGHGTGRGEQWRDQGGTVGEQPLFQLVSSTSTKSSLGTPTTVLTSNSFAVLERKDEDEERMLDREEFPPLGTGDMKENGKGFKVAREKKKAKQDAKRKKNKNRPEEEEKEFWSGEIETWIEDLPINAFFMDSVTSPLYMATKPDWMQEENGWIKVEAAVDSGAADCVAPPELAGDYPITESEGQKSGLSYVAATGERLANEGQKTIAVRTEGGMDTAMTFQMAAVNRPLCSVSRICERGNRVIFGEKGGMIKNLRTGREIHFKRKNNVYTLEFWVKPRSTSFSRPGP